MTNQIKGSISLKLSTYMQSAPFVCGFRDKRAGQPFNRLYETTMAQPFPIKKGVVLASAQRTYEEGRLFACEYKGKFIIKGKITREALQKFNTLDK